MCDTIAELASGTYEELGWPELLPFIFQCVQSHDARLQESALLIFAQLAHHIMGTLRQYMATLHEVLTRTLQSPNHDVALASMRATAAFVQVGPTDAFLWPTDACRPPEAPVLLGWQCLHATVLGNPSITESHK